MKVFTSGVIALQARKKRILHENQFLHSYFFIVSGAAATPAPPSYYMSIKNSQKFCFDYRPKMYILPKKLTINKKKL